MQSMKLVVASCAASVLFLVPGSLALAGPHEAVEHPSKKNGTSGRINALYIDLDGTALNSRKALLPETIAALRRFRACGGHVGVASGRTPDQAMEYLKDLPVDLPAVLFNGGLTLVPPRASGESWTVESTNPLSREASLEALRVLTGHLRADQRRVLVQYASGENLASWEGVERSEFLSYARIPEARVQTCDLLVCLPGRLSRDEEQPLKFIVDMKNKKDAQRLDRRLGKKLTSSRSVVGDPDRGVVEVLPTQVNKAAAISAVLLSREISADSLATFGDSENDVEMLRQFGVGYAMRNGMRCARRAADKVLGGKNPPANDTPVIADVVRSLTPAACAPE